MTGGSGTSGTYGNQSYQPHKMDYGARPEDHQSDNWLGRTVD
ncbi:hypothetical protein GCM10012275_13990 [Longimycelium tulufanense]|uniref:Uncharacterized protein n=1 Tax=Longimycelium tulufanense TaxID=907463 RepID=A0A8J3C6X3_9PSEU|nr:hypothetical protein [Longimycelium tulufanense]GGM44170.1 hypothetical protein GCM10012275_13990 [Longimycelium tulufanense]